MIASPRSCSTGSNSTVEVSYTLRKLAGDDQALSMGRIAVPGEPPWSCTQCIEQGKETSWQARLASSATDRFMGVIANEEDI